MTANKSNHDDELPKGWATAKLSEIVVAKKGKKPAVLRDSPAKGFVPYLDIHAIEKSVIRQFAEVKSSKIASKDDLFVVWDGARSGWVGGGITGAIGSTIMALTPQEVDSCYVRYFIASQFQTLNTNTRGTGIPHVDPEVFWNVEVPLAPLGEQRRIVAKLEALLGKVEGCRQRLAKIPVILKRFRQSVLAAACSGRLTADWREEHSKEKIANGLLADMKIERRQRHIARYKNRKYNEPAPLTAGDLPELPASWCWTNFDHCTWEITVGHVGPMKDRYVEKGIPFLRSQNVRPLRFSPDGLVQIPREFHRVLSKSKLEGGEILVTRSGANTGDCCVFPRNMGAANCADLVISRPLSGLCAEYGAMYVCSPAGQAQLELNQTGIAQPHFNIGAMRVKPFPLPPQAEQQEIAHRVEALFALADQLEARYAKAAAQVERLTPALLAKAFRGELVPQDPSDEPVDKLLVRIRAQSQKGQEMKSIHIRLPRIYHAIVPPKDLNNTLYGFVQGIEKKEEEVVVTFDAASASRILDVPIGGGGQYEALMTLPTYVIEARTSRDSYNKLYDRGITLNEGDWYRLDAARGGEFYARNWNGLSEDYYGVSRYLLNKLDTNSLDGVMTRIHLPREAETTSDALERLFPQYDLAESYFIAVYNVGQGLCCALCEASTSAPVMYFDFGAGCYRNYRTRPKKMNFCFTRNPPIILSHWHTDHYLGARLLDKRAQQQMWIAPFINIGPTTSSFAATLYLSGHLQLLPANFTSILLPFGKLYKCTGNVPNDRGVALMAEFTGAVSPACPSRQYRVLLPGDAGYGCIPTASSSPIDALVVTHHGGSYWGTIPPPRGPDPVCAVSYGRKNSYQHPKLSTMNDHARAGWSRRLDSVRGNIALCWPRGIASPLLGCQGTKCDLQIIQQ